MSEDILTFSQARIMQEDYELKIRLLQEQLETVKKQRDGLANFNPDWDMLEATQDSLRKHMAICKDLHEQIEQSDEAFKNQWLLYKDLEKDAIKLKARNEILERVVEEIKERYPYKIWLHKVINEAINQLQSNESSEVSE